MTVLWGARCLWLSVVFINYLSLWLPVHNWLICSLHWYLLLWLMDLCPVVHVGILYQILSVQGVHVDTRVIQLFCFLFTGLSNMRKSTQNSCSASWRWWILCKYTCIFTGLLHAPGAQNTNFVLHSRGFNNFSYKQSLKV